MLAQHDYGSVFLLPESSIIPDEKSISRVNFNPSWSRPTDGIIYIPVQALERNVDKNDLGFICGEESSSQTAVKKCGFLGA